MAESRDSFAGNKIKTMRSQMEENEDLDILMRGLRSQNLSDL